MKVAFVIFGTEPRHWNAGLEVALRELPELRHLEIVWAAGGTPYIPFYSIRGLARRQLSKKMPKKFLEMTAVIEKSFPSISVRTQMLSIKSSVETKKKIKDFLLNNSMLDDLNMLYPMMSAAITNALIYETRNKWASIISHKKLIAVLCISYVSTYEHLTKFILNGDYNHVVFFNGRFIHEKALWAVSESLGIKKTIFECLRDRYILFDHGPHERFSIQKRMRTIWQEALKNDGEAALEIASEYFESLNKSQINRFVPKVFEELKEHFDFSFFTNSDDEAIGLGQDWVSPLGDNFKITNYVIELFKSGKFGTLAIKIHPNVANKAREEQEIWNQLIGNRFVRIFNSQSKISSHQLIKHSKFVITTGSTVGAEAVYNLKPVAILAPARFDQLNCTSNISSVVELDNWCKTVFSVGVPMPELLKNRLKILALGYWMAASGTKHELQEVTLGPNGSYGGESFLGISNGYPLITKIADRLVWNMYFLRIGVRLRIWKR